MSSSANNIDIVKYLIISLLKMTGQNFKIITFRKYADNFSYRNTCGTKRGGI